MAQFNYVFTDDGAATNAPIPSATWPPVLGGADRILYNHLDEAIPNSASGGVCLVGRTDAVSQAQISSLVIGSVWTGGTRQVFFLLRASGADATLNGFIGTIVQGTTTVYVLSVTNGVISGTPTITLDFAAAPVIGDEISLECDSAASNSTFTIRRNGVAEDSGVVPSPTTGLMTGFGFLGTPTTVSVSEVTVGDLSPGSSENTPPDTPTCTVDGFDHDSVDLLGSTFSDDDSDEHAASQWQVALDADTTFSSPVDDSGEDDTNLVAYTAVGLTPDTAYRVRVRYKDDSGDGATEWSEWSTAATFTTEEAPVTAPDPPTGCTATALSSNTNRVTWTDVSGTETSFVIEVAPDVDGSPGTWTELADDVAADAEQYDDDTRQGGFAFWYRVKARNAGGDSSYATTTEPVMTMGSISDTVTLGGSPVEGARVWLIDATDSTLDTQLTDSSGGFSFDDLPGDHRYTVTIEHEADENQYTATPKPFLTPS